MERVPHTRLIIVGGLLVVAALSSFLSYCSSRELSQEIHEMTETETDPQQTLRHSWTSETGEVVVETHRNAGEAVQDFIDRHDEAVQAALVKWPKVG